MTIRVITPRIYELIGQIAVRAAELEFVLAFCAKLADQDGEMKIEDVLSARWKLMSSSRKAFSGLETSGAVPSLPNTENFLKRIEEALAKRDSVVHGLLMHKEKEGLKLFQFRGENWIDIDEASLQSILDYIQSISDETLELRTSIWNELHPDGLIQLGLDAPAFKGAGSTLG